LTELLRQKASELLQAAVQAECEQFLARFAHLRDQDGRHGVVRNGYLPERSVLTGIGPVPVKVPRVRDRIDAGARFESSLVPAYVRRAASVDAALPWLYLRGISQAEVGPALKALVGADAANLSGPVISRLKRSWADEHAHWQAGDLSRDQWVYLWVDGVYSNIRGDNERVCALVVIGVNERGQKRFLAIEDGVRESTQSWREVLLKLKARGMNLPRVAVGDGALGFWAAAGEVFPTTRPQRCWVHKMANVLNYLPKTAQPKAKKAMQEIWMAETRESAMAAFDLFVKTFEPKYPKAVSCLTKDREALLTFYDLPAEHWVHLRTTNPIESTFATIRHRTKRVKGAFSAHTLMAMMFKLAIAAEQSFRRIKGFHWMADVIHGVPFKDGIRQEIQDQPRRAVA
jgi:transposase-like protein